MKKPLLAVLSALLFSVGATAQVGGSWVKIEGQHSGVRERRLTAVTEQAAWENIWKEHDASATAPAVDFSKESVVAVFLGQTVSAGTKVEVVVQDDMLDKSRLNVFYKAVSSGKGFNASVMCEPFVIVKVRKAATIAFEADSRVSVPGQPAAPGNPRDTMKFRALIGALSAPLFDGR